MKKLASLIVSFTICQFIHAQVGIGTPTPTEQLEVVGTTKTTSLKVTGGGSPSDLLKKGDNDMVTFTKGRNGLGLNYIIAIYGTYPSTEYTNYSSPILGEIRLFAGNFPPGGFAFCQGQTLQINSNSALFSLLGTTYGGNGSTNFRLPDLRGAVPVGFGTTGSGPSWVQGERSQ